MNISYGLCGSVESSLERVVLSKMFTLFCVQSSILWHFTQTVHIRRLRQRGRAIEGNKNEHILYATELSVVCVL